MNPRNGEGEEISRLLRSPHQEPEISSLGIRNATPRKFAPAQAAPAGWAPDIGPGSRSGLRIARYSTPVENWLLLSRDSRDAGG